MGGAGGRLGGALGTRGAIGWVEAHLGESGWPRLEGAVRFLWEEEAAAQGYSLDHHHPSSLTSDQVPGPLQGWAI